MDPQKTVAKPLKAADRRKLKQTATIKARMEMKQLTFTAIDKAYGLARGTAWDAMRNPNLKGERAIAAALGTHPHLLWRDRYHASGQRRSELDYSRLPAKTERQKRVGDVA